ncbi:MAG TPA: TolC family protein [Gemmataceae bacterium]|nr:TolC family protein [Gemmataceae bacterium]
MLRASSPGSCALTLFVVLAIRLDAVPASAFAQEQLPSLTPTETSQSAPAAPYPSLAPPDGDKSLPISLPSALQLAHVQAVDIAAAAERIRVAMAVLDQARALWLPTLTVGGDYNRHDGKVQDTSGNILDNSRSSLMFGVGTGIGAAAILSLDDAIFARLVARQQLRARQADLQTAANDTLLAVTDAYFTVQQARGELAGAIEATHRTEEILGRTQKLVSGGLVPALELDRADTELARRQQAEFLARERWRVASADLLRILRLDPSAQVEPAEPPYLRVDLIDLNQHVDDLIPIALTSRPELAAQQAQVQATLALLKQEKLRPLIPSVLLRGFSTPVTGTLAGGIFAGGPNGKIDNTGLRGDLDLQVLWQLDNLGFGNRARIHQRTAENHLAVLELFRIQDRVAAEVAQAYAQAQSAGRRTSAADRGLRSAVASADKNLAALGQTKQAGGVVQTLVRPQEAVAAVQALAQAYFDYYAAIADYDRAQFRLYRALGHPAQGIAGEGGGCPSASASEGSTSALPSPPQPLPPPSSSGP